MRRTERGHILATRQGSKVFLSGGLINFKLHRDINITLIICPQWCPLFLPWAGSKVEKVNKIQSSWFVLLSCWGCRIAKGRRRGLLSHCFLWTACGQAEWHLKTWRRASSVKMLSFSLSCPPPGTLGSASSLIISYCACSPGHTPT